jgi:dolichyl-diphosphooligosaccharide--protein glycosyltransferase
MKITKKSIGMSLFMAFVFMLMLSFYYLPAAAVAKSQGTVLSENWWNALNWMKNNTEECAVVATYWDPGHFITGIARRPVVFDGASQGEIRTISVSGNLTEDEIKKIAVIDKYYAVYDPVDNVTKVTTARIQDIATTLYTDNETMAVEILKKYRMPNCSVMYYIASSDLLGKSVWWSYFATWKPEEKGQKYNYFMIPLYNAKPVPNQNAVAYVYSIGQQQSFIIYEYNQSSMIPYLQQGANIVKVEKLLYFARNGETRFYIQPNADVKGTLWLEPGRQTVIYIPVEFEKSLFTRMFLFNGQDLKYFKYVSSWGGEVKLFKINFDEFDLAQSGSFKESVQENQMQLSAATLPVSESL